MRKHSRGNFRGRKAKFSHHKNGNGNRRGRRPKRLDPQLFVKKAEPVKNETEQFVPQHAFADFAFSDDLKKAIAKRGYKKPTPIQDQCIPALLEGRDVIGIANTGTGKTAAFLLPLIEKVAKNPQSKVLIVAPTRELAIQIDDEFRAFTKHAYRHNKNMRSVVCIGGTNMRRQVEQLYRKPNFIIGTPGRLLDLEKRQRLRFSDYSSIVLDEVDRMLDMGFIHDIKQIVVKLPQNRHSLFFSATLPDKTDDIVQKFLRNPIEVKISQNKSSKNVDQDIIKVSGRNKLDLLDKLLNSKDVEKAIVFGRTKWGVKKLTRSLNERGHKVAEIHGNRSQNQRQQALNNFKSNRINVLLATDVASRGIDVDDISHVINYDAPESYDDYIHRIGRTGRAGKKGTALTFVEA